MPSLKTNVIIQCRFSSTRLPGKAMYPLCGMPLVAFLIRRMKQNLPQDRYRIILATTENREDNPIAAWAAHEEALVVRGSQDDVLSRYLAAQAGYPSDTIVRVTADNPLTCPRALDDAVALLCGKKLDYVITRGFPYGSGVDVFSAGLLQTMDAGTTEPADREHINNHVLNNPGKFNTGYLEAAGALCRPDLRMTVDTLEDYLSLAGIFRRNDLTRPWNMPLEKAIQQMDLDRTTT